MWKIDAHQPAEPQGVSVVVPVYNSEQTLRPLVKRLTAVLAERGEPFEILLVNDGSRDASWAVILDLTDQYSTVRGFDLMRNFGQHNALLCGIRAALYDRVVTMDDDLQHPPEELPALLSELDGGYDVVYGVPLNLPHGHLRNLSSVITKIALQSAMGAETARRVSAFRAFRTQVREAFSQFSGAFVSLDVLLTWGTARFTHVRVRHDPRVAGESNYTWRKLLVHALNMATGFSAVPLHISSLLGLALTIFGFVILLYVLVRYFIEQTAPPGFAFLASLIAIFSGVQMFCLGVIGEYLARVHFRLMDRPSYVVRNAIARGGENETSP